MTVKKQLLSKWGMDLFSTVGVTSEIRYVYMCMVSGLGCRKALVGTRTAISVLLAQMDLEASCPTL